MTTKKTNLAVTEAAHAAGAKLSAFAAKIQPFFCEVNVGTFFRVTDLTAGWQFEPCRTLP